MEGGRRPFYLAATERRQQRASMVLKDVDYVIEAHFELVPDKAGADDKAEKHYNIALRRLRKGQYHHAPYLGTREFAARVQLIEDGTIPRSPLAGVRDLGWMLYDLDFSDPDDIRPRFFHAIMRDGVIDLAQVEVRG